MMSVFPVAYMSVTYAITGIYIALGLLGNAGLAAEIALAHGATLATFHAFSANTRNIILAESSNISVADILAVRLLLVVPLAALALALAVAGAGVEVVIALAVVLRRGVEWIGEVQLSEREVAGDRRFAQRFLALQVALAAVVVGASIRNGGEWLVPALYVWALLPAAASLRTLVAQGGSMRRLRLQTLNAMAPHFGSTSVIGLSIFVFRLIVGILLVREDAGDLFTAIAIGSFIGTIFANVWGPSLSRAERRGGRRGLSPIFSMFLLCLAGAGLLIFVAGVVEFDFLDGMRKTFFFWQALGLSLIGGAVMVLAQRSRIRVLEGLDGAGVFGPEVLSSLLLPAAVAVLYAGYGREGMTPLYLINAVLIYVFFRSAEAEGRAPGAFGIGAAGNVRRFLIVFVLFFPFFFTLSGTIYNPAVPLTDSGGVVRNLPLPLSAVGCYLGILVLGSYRRVAMSLFVIMMLFCGMVAASMVSAGGGIFGERTKLILMVQYMLPMFALTLGQQFALSPGADGILPRALLAVLMIVVPLQLALGWAKLDPVLEHSLYFFSVYQHMQFVPVMFAAGYLVVWSALWSDARYRIVLSVVGVLLAAYIAASLSMLALGLLLGGLGILSALRAWRTRAYGGLAVWAMIVLAAAGYLMLLRQTPEFGWKYRNVTAAGGSEDGRDAEGQPLNRYIDFLAPTVRYWRQGSKVLGPSGGEGEELVNYGIGMAPADHFLEVRGTLRAGAIRISLSSWGRGSLSQEVFSVGEYSLRFPAKPGGRYNVTVTSVAPRGQLLDAEIWRVGWEPQSDWNKAGKGHDAEGYGLNRYIDFLAPIATYYRRGSAIDGSSPGRNRKLVSYDLGENAPGDLLQITGRLEAGAIRLSYGSEVQEAVHRDVVEHGDFLVQFQVKSAKKHRLTVISLVDSPKPVRALIAKVSWEPVPAAAQAPKEQVHIGAESSSGLTAAQEAEVRTSMARRGEAHGALMSHLPLNLRERLFDWHLYLKLISSSAETLLFGHPRPLDRNILSSPHNYYLDFLYNFGFLAFLPLLGLIAYTGGLLWRRRHWLLANEPLLALSLVVAFLVVIDSNFKVTLRQPYSGILAFFLWGILLEALRSEPESEAAIKDRGNGQ